MATVKCRDNSKPNHKYLTVTKLLYYTWQLHHIN